MTQQLSLIQPELKLQSDYTSVIVNFSTGIDSTGTLYWALKHFDRSRIWLIYCDTGLEYDINDDLHARVAQQMKIKPVLLGLPPHPCYEYVNRCSCFACIFMPDYYTAENMKRHPKKFKELIEAEIRHGHTWKQKMSLQELWEEVCGSEE